MLLLSFIILHFLVPNLLLLLTLCVCGGKPNTKHKSAKKSSQTLSPQDESPSEDVPSSPPILSRHHASFENQKGQNAATDTSDGQSKKGGSRSRSRSHKSRSSVRSRSKSGDRNSNEKESVTSIQYATELYKSMERSPKGPDYEQVEYIKGPFSLYTAWGFRKMSDKSSNRKPSKSKSVGRNDEKGEVEETIKVKKEKSEKSKSHSRKSRTKGDRVTISYDTKGMTRYIPRDQLRPHKLRRDRQQSNPYRKIHVHNKIREIGGHILDKETGTFVYIVAQGKQEFDQPAFVTASNPEIV